ncbi:MAG: tandem-95 repeat protein [Candidatus Endonucleobacter sp. (ex Gigantidas childressi)]|nr:tandem-95 repeat protein [Candidatus Endonucleobacter sp. (ex Gigantidas childressi)]
MNSNGNYVVIGHISEDSEPVEVISGDGSIRIVNAGGAVFVGETVLNSYDFPIKISLINNKSILVGLQQERLMEMSDLDDAGISSIDYSNGIDQPVDDFSTNDSSDKDGVIVEQDRLASQSLIERSDKDVDEVFYKSNRVVGIDESQFTEEDVRGDLPAIPVNNLPIIQSQSFTVNENVPSDGSFTIGAVKVIDLDEAQSHVYAIVEDNSDGCFAINPATGDITVVGEIDYENIDSYDLSIKVTDNGIPPLTTLKRITIDIENFNEAPVANPDVATSDENGSLTINVLANDTDADVNDNPSSSILLSTDIVDTNGDILVGMGEVSISNNQVLFALGSDFDYLGDGEVMDLLIRYQMSDSGGLTSNSFLSITITGTNDQPVIDLINASGTLEESNSTTGLSTTGRLSITELDSGETVTISKSDTSITWNGGDLASSLSTSLMSGFVISNSGWSYSTSANLDFLGKDQTIVLKYNVIATDNSGTANAASAEKEVIVTITGTNDQPVIDSITSTGALVEADSTASLIVDGTLSFTELDSGDTVTVSKSDTSITWSGGDLTTSLSATLMNGFVLSNEGWSYNTNVNLDFLGKDQTIILKYNVIATDNSGAANAASAEEEVIITITGTNDQPVIASLTTTGALIEDDSTASLSVDGILSFTDLDSKDTVTVSKSDTSITWNGGELTSILSATLMSGFVISNEGWSYNTNANLDFLGKDQTIVLKYNIIGTDNSGAVDAASAEEEVIITITGTNDAPTLNVESTKTVNEDGNITITFESADIDGTVTTTATAENGIVVVNGNGTISYSPNKNYNGSDTITVTATDNDGGVVVARSVITVNDVNDVPTIDVADTVKVDNHSLNLNGITEKVAFDDPTINPDNFTISVLVNTATINDGLFHGFLGFQDANLRSPSMWVAPSNGGLHYDAYDEDTGERFNNIIQDVFLAAGTPVHITWIKDGNEFRIHIDGNPEPIHTGPAPDRVHINNTYNVGGVDNYFDGTLDDIQIYNKALEPEDVTKAYHGEITQWDNITFLLDFEGDSPLENKADNDISFTIIGNPNIIVENKRDIVSVEENTTTIVATADDIDGTVNLTDSKANNGTLSMDVDGNILFTPDANYNGSDIITILVTDDDGATAKTHFNIMVNPDNVGTLIDGVIDGVAYTTSSGLTGLTDADGAFLFNNGDTITFSIGNIELGTITAEEAQSGQTFLQDIANVERGNLNDHYLENMATFLQSLDSDEGDNIVITAEIHTKLEDLELNLHTASEEEVKALVESIGKEFVSEEDAMEHVQEMLEKYTDMQSDDFDAHTDDSLTTARLGTLPVVGVNYTTSSGITGITNTDGSFSFNIGDEITFSNANGQEIASIAAEHIGSDKLITMQELLTHAPDMQTQGNEDGTLFIANDDREVIFTDADLFSDNNLVPQTSIDDVDNAGANSLLTDSGTVPDLFSTNHDNISVSGGASIYTFDLNAAVTPENKTSFSVSDFNIDEGDVLLLGDLMVDEDNSLEQLLDFSTSSSETVINIRDVAGGDVTRQVTLDNVDLSVYGNTDAEIINKLLDDGNLQIDS